MSGWLWLGTLWKGGWELQAARPRLCCSLSLGEVIQTREFICSAQQILGEGRTLFYK